MLKSSGFVFFALFTGVAFPAQRGDCPPDRNPDIRGVITSISGSGPGGFLLLRVLVEEEPQAQWGAAKAQMAVSEDTRVFRQDWKSPSLSVSDDLRVGITVQAWFRGPVALSYPVQAAAACIIIEEPEE